MEKFTTPIRDLLIIKPDVFQDERGHFMESYNQEKFRELGINDLFVQENLSFSKKGAIRGLHFQVGKSAQGKLAKVIHGKVLDVAVDIRFGSPTFGFYHAVELSSENNLLFWIPPGFAHGISVLSDIAYFSYKCTSFYSREDERAIRYNDPDLHIDWKIDSPIVSGKDLASGNFRDIEKYFTY